LGRSEILAHIYGGLKAGKTLENKVKGAWDMLKHLISSRGIERPLQELSVAATAIAVPVVAIKEVKNRMEGKPSIIR